MEKNKNSSKTILLVEDDKSLNKIIRLKLENFGYNVLLAEDAEEALKILDAHLPDLIWLDIYLPGISGLELLKKIRQNRKTKDLKIAIVSVSGNNLKMEIAEKFSVKDFFIKSNYNLDELIKDIGNILNK